MAASSLPKRQEPTVQFSAATVKFSGPVPTSTREKALIEELEGLNAALREHEWFLQQQQQQQRQQR